MSDFLSQGFPAIPTSPLASRPQVEQRLTLAGVTEAALPYAAATLPGFEALKHAVSLLAGVLLLDLVGAERGLRDRSITAQAEEVLDAAAGAIRSAQVPVAMEHHHRHLMRALARASAVAAHVAGSPSRLDDPARDAIGAELSAAWADLRHASNLLNGFEIVDYSNSCCAFHARQMAAVVAQR